MSSFQIAFSVVAPLMIYMVIGYLIRRAGICSVPNFKALNQVLFRVFIPLSLFFNVYRAELSDVLQPRLVLLIETLLILTVIITWHLFKRFVSDGKDLAVIVQGIARSNYVLFGSLVAAELCDERGVALVAALCAFVVPTVNIEGVVLFELIRGDDIKPADLLLRIFKNPLVLAGLLGVLFNVLHIPMANVISSPLTKLGNAATPVAMVTLGAILNFGSIQKHIGYIMAAVCGKLVIVPIIAVLAGILLGYRGNELVAILAVFGSPTAVASAPMAQAMGGNGELAGEIVAATSVICLGTLFVLVMALAQMHFI